MLGVICMPVQTAKAQQRKPTQIHLTPQVGTVTSILVWLLVLAVVMDGGAALLDAATAALLDGCCFIALLLLAMGAGATGAGAAAFLLRSIDTRGRGCVQ
jgi:hypothetical protein